MNTTATCTLTKTKTCSKCGHEQKITTKANRTTCSQCDTKIPLKAVVAILAAVMMLAVVPISYAEISVTQDNLTEAEQKVLDDIAKAKADGTYVQPPEHISVQTVGNTVTVTSPFEISSQTPPHCQIQKEGIVPVMICSIRGVTSDGSEPVWDIEKEQWTSQLALEQEAKEMGLQQQVPIEAEPMTKEQQYNEERIAYILQRNNPTELELRELAARQQIGAKCTSDTKVSQTYREYDVLTEVYLDPEGQWKQQLKVNTAPDANDSRDNRFVLSLEKQVQECIGQPHTKKSIQYDHIVVDGLFEGDPNMPQLPDAISQSQVNEMANNAGTADVYEFLKDRFCNNQYAQVYESVIECEMKYDAATLPTPETQPYSETDPMKKLEQYKVDKGETQKQDIIDEKQSEIYNRYFR